MARPLRLFVAIRPPPEVQAAMVAAVASAGVVLPPHRLLAAGEVHMTLAFIGDTQPKALREVKESVERSCSGLEGFQLRPQRLITIPTPEDGGPPRLLAVTTDAPPALLEIQRRLATRLTSPRKSGRRSRFLPHLTVCRYRGEGTSDPVDAAVGLPVFGVGEVSLYSSVLGPEGARHEAVHTVTLA